MRCRSIDTFNIKQHKNLTGSLNKLTIEKSKKIGHLEKEERLLEFRTCLHRWNISIGI